MKITENKAVHYQICQTTNNEKNGNFKPIHKLEDLFWGKKQNLQHFFGVLLKEDKIEEAKGFWERNKHNLKAVSTNILKNERWYNPINDPGAPPKDVFGPISTDPKCMKLDPHVKVAFVGNEEQVLEMEKVLQDSDFIGLNTK